MIIDDNLNTFIDLKSFAQLVRFQTHGGKHSAYSFSLADKSFFWSEKCIKWHFIFKAHVLLKHNLQLVFYN